MTGRARLNISASLCPCIVMSTLVLACSAAAAECANESYSRQHSRWCCRFEVPDVEAACKRFDELGVEFVKRPNDGKMRGLAFIKVQMLLEHQSHHCPVII